MSNHPLSPDFFAGKTVAIIGNAPTLTDEQLEKAKSYPSVVVNRAVARAPWADVLVSIDANWPQDIEFAGITVIGVQRDDMPQAFATIPYEAVALSPGHVVHIRQNTLAAMRIAADAGASRLLLIGIDEQNYETLHAFDGFAIGLMALSNELAARGIPVERLAAASGQRKPARKAK